MKKFLSAFLALAVFMCGATKSFAENNTTAANVLGNSEENDEELTFLGELFGNRGIFYSTINGTKNIANRAINSIEKFGQLGFRLSGISYGLSALMSLYVSAKSLYDKIKLRFSKINQDVDVVNEAFDKELQCIKGQDKAKKRMKEIVASVIDARNEAKENNKPYGKGDVIYMIGPSGVGKTFSAECLARAIMGANAQPVRIDSSCFEKDTTTSVKSQILYMREQQRNTSGSSYYYVDNSIAAQIASNPNTVLIFDEYDKWCTPDTDEFLRAIMDKGVIYRDGEKIDCSGILVIVISNEDLSSVTAGNNCGVFKDDGTGSRTHNVHDKSFLNRLNIIEFENLSEDDYELITQYQLKIIADRYQKLFSINLDFGDTARKIAIATARRNQGAREIEKILASLKMEVISARQDNKKPLGLFEHRFFKINYDCDNDRFTVKEKNNEEFNGAEDLENKIVNRTPTLEKSKRHVEFSLENKSEKTPMQTSEQEVKKQIEESQNENTDNLSLENIDDVERAINAKISAENLIFEKLEDENLTGNISKLTEKNSNLIESRCVEQISSVVD